MQSLSRTNHQLKILLIMLLSSLLFFSILYVWEAESRRDLFGDPINHASTSTQSKKTDPIHHCLRGSQSQRSRHCPPLIREVRKIKHSLESQCIRKDNILSNEHYFNGKTYRCSNIFDVTMLDAQFLRALQK